MSNARRLKTFEKFLVGEGGGPPTTVRTLVGYALIIPNVANYRNYIGLQFAFVQFIYGMSKSVTTVGECGASSITLD